MGLYAEVATELESRTSGDAALAQDDFVDPPGRDTEGEGQAPRDLASLRCTSHQAALPCVRHWRIVRHALRRDTCVH